MTSVERSKGAPASAPVKLGGEYAANGAGDGDSDGARGSDNHSIVSSDPHATAPTSTTTATTATTSTTTASTGTQQGPSHGPGKKDEIRRLNATIKRLQSDIRHMQRLVGKRNHEFGAMESTLGSLGLAIDNHIMQRLLDLQRGKAETSLHPKKRPKKTKNLEEQTADLASGLSPADVVVDLHLGDADAMAQSFPLQFHNVAQAASYSHNGHTSRTYTLQGSTSGISFNVAMTVKEEKKGQEITDLKIGVGKQYEHELSGLIERCTRARNPLLFFQALIKFGRLCDRRCRLWKRAILRAPAHVSIPRGSVSSSPSIVIASASSNLVKFRVTWALLPMRNGAIQQQVDVVDLSNRRGHEGNHDGEDDEQDRQGSSCPPLTQLASTMGIPYLLAALLKMASSH